MANSINATSTGNGGIITTGDDSGVLNIQTNETTAMSVDASQSVDFVNNIDAPNTFGFKNRVINGGMVIDQRNAGASVTVTGNPFTLDRWYAAASIDGKYTVQQNAGSVTPPAGHSNYLGCTVGASANVTVGSGDYFGIRQTIEGFNTADLNFGSSSAATVTISFWVRSSVTGTYGVTLKNNDNNRAYAATYTISSANTWEQKSITIAGDTTGTWIGATNGAGMRVTFGLGVGSTYSGATGSWQSANLWGATGATNWISTNSATFYVTGVQLEKGTQATSFDFRSYGTELALCQRYYVQQAYSTGGNILGVGTCNATTDARCVFSMPVTMRAAPTGLLSSGTNYYGVDKPGTGFVNFNSMSIAYQSPSSVLLYASSISGMTTGYSIVMYMVASGASIGLSAEL